MSIIINGTSGVTFPDSTTQASAANVVSTTTYNSGSGNWTKPSTGTFALVQMWAGGGSGQKTVGTAPGDTARGGGGGGYLEVLYLLSSLGSTVAYSVGAGGAAVTATVNTDGNNGGNTTFGSLTVYGGAGGSGSGTKGAGGSWQGVGQSNISSGAIWDGGTGLTGDGSKAADLLTQKGFYGGGAGGGGGDGGIISSTTAGGTSVFGGAGGAGNATSGGTAGSGSAPGGGGGGKVNGTTGSSGAGANGRIVIMVW